MSPILNRRSVIQRFEGSNAIDICDGITFNFYMGLPHVLSPYCIQLGPFNAHSEYCDKFLAGPGVPDMSQDWRQWWGCDHPVYQLPWPAGGSVRGLFFSLVISLLPHLLFCLSPFRFSCTMPSFLCPCSCLPAFLRFQTSSPLSLFLLFTFLL